MVVVAAQTENTKLKPGIAGLFIKWRDIVTNQDSADKIKSDPRSQKLAEYSNQSDARAAKTNQDNAVKPHEDAKAKQEKP